MKRKSKQYPPKNKKLEIRRKFRLRERSRVVQRRRVALRWLREKPYSRYRYKVEKADDGTEIYLARPTQLNKGFDFEVRVKGFRSRLRTRKRKTERPSHPDVFHDLRLKLREKPRLRKRLFKAICSIYDGSEPKAVLKRHRSLKGFSRGLPIDLVLKVIKWLFIEQDLTYWLGTGRDMLMNAIERKVFKIKAPLYET